MAEFRPEHQLNIDDGGRPFSDEEEDWGEYELTDWVLLLDGLTPEEKEEYRPLMQDYYLPIFFDDVPFPGDEPPERERRADLGE